MLALLGVLSALLIACGIFGAEGALANTYTGLLYGGTVNITSNDASESGGYVYGADSWTAPSGTQLGGFAYTSAAFSSVSDNSVGGVSAGFGGDGSANQPSILFPWTDDCSITNSGHYWTNAGVATMAGTSGSQTCNTSGDSASWNYENSELENSSPGTDPETGYQTLWLTVFCQAATCNYDPDREWGTAGVSVTNLSGDFDDSYNQPAGGASWASSVSGSAWYQTNGGGVALNLSASDPGGVCALYGYLTGAATVTGGLVGNQNPAVTSIGDPIGEEFSSGTDPCWVGQTDTGTWTLPADLTSGTYNANVAAANPGNYEAQGFSASSSPTIATYDDSINIDDTTPSGTWAGAPGGWTSSATETLDVSVGPSGLAAVTCTDNGSNVAATLVSGSTSGAGTSVWNVPTATNGANGVSCSMMNGDADGSLTGSTSHTFDVDTTVPVVGFADGGYTPGGWTNQTQMVVVSATGGPSGIQTVSCSVDGGPGEQLDAATGGTVDIFSNGQHTLDCTATSNTHISGEATYSVNIDTYQPSLTFLVNGTVPSSAWLSGAPVVTVIGSEDGGILSGLKGITCSVNGGNSFSLSGIDSDTDYTGSFELEQNGADQVSCTGTTVAGTTQATPATVTVNLDNPNYSPNPSALIDDGADPFSTGPSQSQWYATPQSVTITANDTGGSAPIASIACKGALVGNWPISNLNTDAQGGEQITLTVPAPGGDLSCTAEDAAGNVYALGSYLFQIDNTAPVGYFVPQADWPEPDEIEIHAADNGGSGVAVVRVYGESSTVDQGQPQLVGDAQYDANTGDYLVTIPDGVAPWVAGNWKFYANVVDVAGNQAQITAGANGSTEDLTLPLREDTSVTAAAQRVTATEEPAIPSELAAAALGTTSTGASIAHVTGGGEPTATVARAKPRKPSGHVLTVRYGKKVTISGLLKDVARGGKPIIGAKILVYQEIAGASRYTKLGSARTNVRGKYTYRVRAGASRTLYVVYPGTSVLRSAASDLEEKFAGKLTFRASRIPAGGSLVVTGTVKGGHIPPGGLNVTIDYRQMGAPGSGTLGAVRTNSKGKYRFAQHFAANTGGLTYQLWAVVPGRQPKWPYLKASTTRLIRRVN
jgi:hypothetical protein